MLFIKLSLQLPPNAIKISVHVCVCFILYVYVYFSLCHFLKLLYAQFQKVLLSLILHILH